jgi:hypothetical protein
VAKTLYATKRARPLTMRVWAPAKDDLEQTDSPNEISQRHGHAATDP